MKKTIIWKLDREYIIDYMQIKAFGKSDIRINILDKNKKIIYTHFQQNQSKISNNILDWTTRIYFNNFGFPSTPIPDRYDKFKYRKKIPVTLGNKMFNRVQMLFNGRRFIKTNDIKNFLNKNTIKDYDSYLAICLELLFQIFIELDRNCKIYLYLDKNEYRGWAYSDFLLKNQKELAKKNNFNQISFDSYTYEKHSQLSTPIFITDQKIIDIPSYVDEIELFHQIYSQKQKHETCELQINTSKLLNSKNNHFAQNKNYENLKNGKSNWMKDVEKGILFNNF